MTSISGNLFFSIYIIAVYLFTGCAAGSGSDGFVLDHENVLDSLQERKLDSLYKSHETKTTNQVVLLTTPGFETDSTIESYSLRKFNSFGIGRKETNNGVLIVFSSKLRQVRIATGYGTQRVLTDSIAKAIIDTAMIPYFKKAEYFDGLWRGSIAITGFLERPENKIVP